MHPEAILAPSSMAAPPRKPNVGLMPVVVPHVPERWAESPAPATAPNQKTTWRCGFVNEGGMHDLF